jgi:hypothetical protein
MLSASCQQQGVEAQKVMSTTSIADFLAGHYSTQRAVKMRQVNHILAVVLVIAFTFTMAWPRSTAWAAGSAFQVPAGQRQLFLDDVGIVKIENLTRTMHQPDKLIVISTDTDSDFNPHPTDSDFKYGKRGLIMKSTLTRLILVLSAMPSFILLASNQTPRNQRARGSFAGECDHR